MEVVEEIAPQLVLDDVSTGALPGNSFRERLVEFFRVHQPDQLKNVDLMAQKYAGKERMLFAALERKYGRESNCTLSSGFETDSNDAMRSRLLAFYTKYQPGKLLSVDEVCRKYKGMEDELFRCLVKKYGPE